MGMNWIDVETAPGGFASANRLADESCGDLLVANCLAAAASGDTDAYYDLGVAF
jgi:hypothetical protein